MSWGTHETHAGRYLASPRAGETTRRAARKAYEPERRHARSLSRADRYTPGNPPVRDSAAAADPGLHPRFTVPAQTGLLECQGPRRGPVACPLRHHGD